MTEPTRRRACRSRPDYVASLFDLAGRVAVVTGGGSGLGRAIADRLCPGGRDGGRLPMSTMTAAAETVALIADQGGTRPRRSTSM